MKRLFRSPLSHISLSVLLILSFCVSGHTQKNVAKSERKVKIAVDKPGTYITFERFGKRTPLRTDESGEAIWLRLHNNMRFTTTFCTYGISESGEQLVMTGSGGRMGLYYDVVVNPVSMIDNRPSFAAPVGYPIGATCQEFELGAGKSIVFDVPAEHLVRGLSIKIGFNYEWEETGDPNPTHFVYFNSLSIPHR